MGDLRRQRGANLENYPDDDMEPWLIIGQHVEALLSRGPILSFIPGCLDVDQDRGSSLN